MSDDVTGFVAWPAAPGFSLLGGHIVVVAPAGNGSVPVLSGEQANSARGILTFIARTQDPVSRGCVAVRIGSAFGSLPAPSR